MFVIKNNFVQKSQKVTFGTVSALIAQKYRCLLHVTIIMSHGTTVLEARPNV